MKIRLEFGNMVSNSLANFGDRTTANSCITWVLFWWGGTDTFVRDCT